MICSAAAALHFFDQAFVPFQLQVCPPQLLSCCCTSKRNQQAAGMPPPVVLITGCSEGGIGAALVQQFAAAGCSVFASARRLAAMQSLTTLPGVQLVRMDVCSSDSIQAAVAEVVSKAGRVDVLVNNAGVVMLGPTAEVPLAAVRQCFDANVFGLLELCQAVVPTMAAQGSGKIINIGSLTGFTPVPLRGIYSATKAAVLRLSDALRLECRPLGIQVLLVAPGFIDTKARGTAKSTAESYSSSTRSKSLWTGWMDLLEVAMRKLLKNVVPADLYAARLVAVCLRPHLPRYWVGPCAGIEWVVRYLPLALQDWLVYKSFNLAALEPVLAENAAALRQAQQASSS